MGATASKLAKWESFAYKEVLISFYVTYVVPYSLLFLVYFNIYDLPYACEMDK